MLTKDVLRVSRAGGGYHPQFADRKQRPLAATVTGTFQGHVGEPRGRLDDALADLEPEAEHFKLVRGFSSLLERSAVFDIRAPIDPNTARREAFEAAEAIDVVTEDERAMALIRAGESLGVSADDVETSLYADLDERQVLTSFDSPWDPDELLMQYNLSLAQTALFNATRIRVRSSDPRALISAIKRLRLLYEIENTERGREVIITGPTELFRATRRYGTRFARLLRTLVRAQEWSLEATIDDNGTERTMHLDHTDPIDVPEAEPVIDVTYDSGIEADFAARIEHLDLDWELLREPEPLETGTRVMIPDFAFDYAHTDFRVYVEIMGFWTPEYVEKKLRQLEQLADVDMLVVVDESLGVTESIEAIEGMENRVIPYKGTVRIKDVIDVLSTFEQSLVEQSVERLPDEMIPDEDVITIAELADRYGVSSDAIIENRFPEHAIIGRTLVRPAILESIDSELTDGMAMEAVDAVLDSYALNDASSILSRLDYRVEWEGLGSGTIREDS